MEPRVIAMLPCHDIDQIATLFTGLGFAVTYRQTRPNPYLAREGYGIPLHYYGLPGFDPATSHSTCGIVVDDPRTLFDAWANGLRAQLGRLPLTGLPRITRPRPRKNAAGSTGFSLIDPAGN